MNPESNGYTPERPAHPIKLFESVEATDAGVTCHLAEDAIPQGCDSAYVVISFPDDRPEQQIDLNPSAIGDAIEFPRPADSFSFRLVVTSSAIGRPGKVTVHPGAISGSQANLAEAAFSFEIPSPN